MAYGRIRLNYRCIFKLHRETRLQKKNIGDRTRARTISEHLIASIWGGGGVKIVIERAKWKKSSNRNTARIKN